MRRVATWCLAGLGVILLLVAAGATYFLLRFPAVAPAGAVRVEATPERLARGQYLFNHVAICVDCHSTRDWTKYAGPIQPGTHGKGGDPFTPNEMPGLPGSFYARNITPAGIGDWTDGELIRAITTGVNKHGDALFPLMPYLTYGVMDQEDVTAIVAYVRTLAPIPNHVPERSFQFPMQFIVRTIPRDAQFGTRPSRSDTLAYGRYLTQTASCAECHTPRDDRGQPVPGRDFAGGQEFLFPGGSVVRTANLTPDADTGLGAWSEQQFVDKFKAFEGAAEQPLAPATNGQQNTPMPWKQYAGMTRDDLAAIYAYLRSLPPVINRVQKFDTASTVASR